MDNIVPARELNHKFYNKYKDQRLFLVDAHEINSKPTLLVGITDEQIPCMVKSVLKCSTQEDMVKQVFTKYQKLEPYFEFAVIVYGMVEDFNSYTIVMEDMAGSLSELLYSKEKEFALQIRKTWNETGKMELALKCLECVVKLHELGIVLRDVHLGNFLVNAQGKVVKFCDFGTMKDNCTETKLFGDNVAYLAPERITKDEKFEMTREQWQASDLYSMGVVMCEILLGVKPFHYVNTSSAEELFEQRLQDTSLRPFDTIIGNSLCTMVMRELLAHDGSMRNAKFVCDLGMDADFCFAIENIYIHNNTDIGIPLLVKSAEQSNVFACQLLINLFRSGIYVPKNEHKATVYSIKRDSINQGSSKVFAWLQRYLKFEDVHLLVALAYSEGWGCNKDDAKHLAICQQYSQSHIAQNSLGLCYDNGIGVAQDCTQAVYWYRLAAEQGNANAQNNLGLCYYNGNGVEQDFLQAVHWLKLAATQANAGAQNNLGWCYDNGHGVEKNYWQAFHWFKLAAEQGHTNAQNNLGWCYYNGNGVAQNYAQAVHWYTLASEKTNANAQNNLGLCYYNGHGVVQDFSLAVHWYTLAAEQGNADAQNGLAICYANGQGVTKSITKAMELFHASVAQGDAEAQCNLATIFADGIGVAKNLSKALELYKLAAEQGNQDAMNKLKKWNKNQHL